MADEKADSKAEPKAEPKKVKARVLVECDYGVPNDVVEIATTQVKALAGVVDTDPEAVAYAESLAK